MTRVRQPDSISELRELATLHGIEAAYTDMAGQTHHAAPETLKALLRVLGEAVERARDIRDALHEKKRELAMQVIEPVIVAWNGRPRKTELCLPISNAGKKVACTLTLEHAGEKMGKWESGKVRKWELTLKGSPTCSPAHLLTCSLSLPALPYGYHRLQCETDDGVFQSLIISAPEKSFSPPSTKQDWGVFFPIYSLHSQRSWGAGNFTDWAEFTRWAASFGANVMGTLPLLAAFLDGPFGDPSPYSPASRLFWNEFYLDITAIPEFTACAEAQKLAGSAAFQKRLETFRRGALIDYRSEMAVRRKVLEQLGRFFFSKSSARRREFERFLSARPGVEQYAEFRAVCEKTARPWQLWPQRLREGSLRKGDYSEETKRYHLYVQWLAQEQMDQLLQAANRAGAHFYLDLPLGVNPAGYDTWREREVFALNASAGAPPDVFFTKGQDWGFAPLHPQKLRAQGYRYVLDYLRFQMRHTDLLRIDHVMSLHRLYWIPNGFSAAEGAYVTYRADELYALFCLESHRHRTMLVGENLGTVPPEVNAAMERHRLRKMYVVQYEQRTDPKAALPLPPRQCVASMNTHDMPPFAAFWRGDDIADRADLGLIRGKKLREQKRTRKKMKEALVIFLRRHGLLQTKPPGPADVFRACLEWLSSSRAETVLINLEDLWGETLQQNVPGTLNERPNWRRKARLTLEEIRQLPQVAQLLRNASAIRSRRSTPRTDSERQHRKGVSRAFRISSPHRVGRDAAETFRASNP